MKKKLVQNLYDEDLYAMAHACLNGKCTQYCDPARKECKNCRYFVHKYTDDEKKVFYNYTLAFSHYENENERIRRKNEYIKRKDQRPKMYYRLIGYGGCISFDLQGMVNLNIWK